MAFGQNNDDESIEYFKEMITNIYSKPIMRKAQCDVTKMYGRSNQSHILLLLVKLSLIFFFLQSGKICLKFLKIQYKCY